ncbi:primosomal protein N' [Candidatus Saccharibacteria bacterium]|nr:primosomal protein N' [Candidatus Saccharibacteria bacterium]
MHYYEVAPTKIVRAKADWFTYHSETAYVKGDLVTIPVGNTLQQGIILKKVNKPTYATKPINSRIETLPLPRPLVNTALWMSEYYHTPLATVLQTVLPRGLTKNRRSPKEVSPFSFARETNDKRVFTADQTKALDTINAMTPGTAILHGNTGSGKTAVYIELANRAIARGESVVVLVPEIALTSQLVAEFSQHFSDIIVAHSKQTEAQRHIAFKNALASPVPQVVIGPRSALFLPLARIGLIVIDEFHEPSFKQEQSPRYSSLRVARILAHHHKAKLVLGSATPPVSEYYLAESSNRPVIRMVTSARSNTIKPTATLVDMTKRDKFTKHRFLSNTLLEAIETNILEGTQSLIFHNRRGSATTTLCESCGWQAFCPQCVLPLTLHTDQHKLRCHMCGHHERVPTSCPECHAADIIHKGIGTKMIETELSRLFPKARIARFDADSDNESTVNEQYQALYDGDIDIIIGTQVIAKGLDLPHLRTVGVVQADGGLSLPDYGASERTFQLLAQVIGRVGRNHHPTAVIVQTYQPSHPAIIYGLAQQYHEFYAYTLKERKKSHFPPFTYLLKLQCSYKTEAVAIKNARTLRTALAHKAHADVLFFGPTPSFYERANGLYRWQIILKSPQRAHLTALLNHLPPQHWQYELDPLSLL